MFRKITTTVFAVLVSLSVGGWLGYVGHTRADANEKQKTVEITKANTVSASASEAIEPDLMVAEEDGVPKWSPKASPAVAAMVPPSVGAASRPAQVPAQPSQPDGMESSVFKLLDVGVLKSYQLKTVPSAACLPYAQRVATALEYNAATDALAAYRTRVHESVQSGYSIGCFVKQEQADFGATGSVSQPSSIDARTLACQTYLDAVVNRIRGSKLAENEKQQHLADLYAYAAQSRCAP